MTFKGRLLMRHFIVRRVAAILPMSQKTLYAKHSIQSDKLLTACTRHGVDAVVDRLSAGE